MEEHEEHVAYRLLNLSTLLGLGFAALTVVAYLNRDYNLASFYLLMAGSLILGQASHLAPKNKPVRLAADVGVALLAGNTLLHYGLDLSNIYSVIALLVLVAAVLEALVVARKA